VRILITGGAGFIGSHLGERLVLRGHSVVVVDNLSTGRKENLAKIPEVPLFVGTVADQEWLSAIFEDVKPEVVVHAAASYADPQAWAPDMTTNGIGSGNVATLAWQGGAHVVYLQTALAYGLRPLESPVRTTHPLLSGGSSYAISKTMGEHYLRLSGAPLLVYRLANVYGPRCTAGPIPAFYGRLSSGEPCHVTDTRRDFVFVEDVADCLTLGIEEGLTGAYHIASGVDLAILDVYGHVAVAMGVDPIPRVDVHPAGADDAATIFLDPTTTMDDLGWRAATSLKEGIERTISYYQEFGVRKAVTHLSLPSELSAG
jgi:UDP-glucose 4-epimerase